ncbi:50S ribosome-binding protein YggL [Neisseria sp. Dent CA1/247]|uniref:50S ribosome-binding protein YggL n=1 Tax=Neisseria sp. Dent CA1/247 TaxID=2912675 RepID=UPI001FD03B6A|nr:50S ribosome-binding protein YggL [Neisseria sp. Dent CA1/247]UOO77682.1 50S ribosome-binding protein YggL [Neisseria sp. Dent CA1/247]
MNARQRKKFYVGEYQNLVFSVCGSLMPEYRTAACFEQFIDDVIDWVYANSMCLVSGGTTENFSYRQCEDANLISKTNINSI